MAGEFLVATIKTVQKNGRRNVRSTGNHRATKHATNKASKQALMLEGRAENKDDKPKPIVGHQ